MEDLWQTANEISVKISEALEPINAYTAPIATVVLENYAEALKKQDFFLGEPYEFAKNVIYSETHVLSDTEENSQTVEALKKYALGERKEIFRGKL